MIWSFVPISTIGTIISNLLYLLPSAYRHLNPSCLLNFLKFFLHIYIYVWLFVCNEHCTKNEVFIKDFFIKCDQIGKIHNAKLHCLRSGDTSTFDINAHVLPLVSLYTPLKTSENLWFSHIFRGYRKRPVASNSFFLVFVFRPLELFRRCNSFGDSSASRLHTFFSNSIVPVSNYSLIFKDLRTCQPEMFKVGFLSFLLCIMMGG